MQEDDGLARVARSRLAQRRAHVADPQLGAAHALDALAPRRGPWAAQDARDDGRAHDVRWRLAHPHHGDEGARDRGVVLGRRPQPAQVGVDGPHARRPAAVHLGQRQVGPDRQLPRVVDGGGGGAEEPAREVALPALQALAQRDRLGGGDCHSLPVGRVERADGVAADQQPLREPAQALVAAPRAGREAVRHDVVERLGRLDRRQHVGRRDRGGERREALGIARWAVRGAVAAERQDPAPAFLGEQEQRARVARPGADQHQPVAVERVRRQSQVPARVCHVDRQPLLARPRVAEPVEPGRDARAAAAGGDDEIRGERLLRAAVGAPQEPHSGDALAVRARRQPEDVAAVDQLDAGQRPYAPAHVALDERPPGEDRMGAGRRAASW